MGNSVFFLSCNREFIPPFMGGETRDSIQVAAGELGLILS